MITVPNTQDTDAQLAAAALVCPDCGDRLAPWGFARWRSVRGLAKKIRVRPRRTICVGCSTTHVLQPAELVPRRSVTVDVIGSVLLAAAEGAGHRSIAATRGFAAGTVRNWLRRFRANAESLRITATITATRLDPELPSLSGRAHPLAEAVDALGAVAAAALRRLGLSGSVWQRIALITRGQLLAPPTRSG